VGKDELGGTPQFRVTARKKNVRIGTLELSALTRVEAVDAIVRLVRERKGGMVFTPNVDHVVQAEHHARFREAYAAADLALVDGTPVLWAARWLGTPLPEKLSGSDLFEPLLERAASEGFRVALLGGGPGVAELAAARLTARFKTLQIVETTGPRLGVAPGADEANVVEQLARARADLIFVCLGAPKQELFSHRNRAALEPAVLVCFGAAVDFAAGTLPRAPAWMSRAGLEWAYRLAREPRRLAVRYLLRDPEFFAIIARQALSRRTSGS